MSDGTQSAVDVTDPRRIIRSAEQLADLPAPTAGAELSATLAAMRDENSSELPADGRTEAGDLSLRHLAGR